MAFSDLRYRKKKLTFLTPTLGPGTKFILARVFKEGKEGRDLNAGRPYYMAMKGTDGNNEGIERLPEMKIHAER